MSSLDGELRAALAALDAVGARYALVGGLAVSVRAEPRLTRDVDVAVAVTDDPSAEALVYRLGEFGYRTVFTLDQTDVDRLATVRVRRADESVVVDLLFASSGIEPEIVDDAEPVEIVAGLVAPVASVAALIVTKLLARDDRRRPADADDLRNLSQVATAGDWARAAVLAELVQQRGYGRDRDVPAALAELRERGAY